MTRDYKILLLVLTALLATSLLVKIDLVTADLGRHIKNGEIILTGSAEARHAVLTTNYYSYTEGDTPFINHHWLSGVVFYFVYILAGFNGLSIFYIVAMLAAFLLVFDLARRRIHPIAVAVASSIAIPVIASRAEVRPEVFTYLFVALFIWICVQCYEHRIDRRWLWSLPIVQLLWVNLHVGFILGIGIIGTYVVALLLERALPRLKEAVGVLLVSCLALLVNPAFYAGALYPFTIFQEYSYRVFENQSVSFLMNLGVGNRYTFTAFGTLLGLVVVSYAAAAYVNRRRISIILLLCTVAFGSLGFLAIRDFPLFGLIAIVAFAANMNIVFDTGTARLAVLKKETFIVVASMAALLFGALLIVSLTVSRSAAFGIGTTSDVSRAAEFIKANQLQGPVFNNYDIGGYLIFYLFPQEKVFFDNRPETYSREFVNRDYIGSMEDQAAFDRIDGKYHFNSIVFSYRDYTPWAQTFLIEKIHDPDWVPVYVDSVVLIMLRKNAENETIIRQYEIPRDVFSTTN